MNTRGDVVVRYTHSHRNILHGNDNTVFAFASVFIGKVALVFTTKVFKQETTWLSNLPLKVIEAASRAGMVMGSGTVRIGFWVTHFRLIKVNCYLHSRVPNTLFPWR